MEDKKPSASKLETFFAGKGFYIVLVLCVSVIGVSAWSMLTGGQKKEGEDMALTVAGMEQTQPSLDKDMTPPRVPDTQVISLKPEPTAEPEPAETAATPEPLPEAEEPAATQSEPVAAVLPAEEQPPYFIWPVTGEVEAAYAMAYLTFDPTMRDWRTHDGLDIAAEMGTQVRAAADGTVTAVYNDEVYGTTVVLRHAGGLESRYSNLNTTPTVSVDQRVSVGEILGAVGDTALCEIGEASHLHFAMTLDGVSADPGEYLP